MSPHRHGVQNQQQLNMSLQTVGNVWTTALIYWEENTSRGRATNPSSSNAKRHFWDVPEFDTSSMSLPSSTSSSFWAAETAHTTPDRQRRNLCFTQVILKLLPNNLGFNILLRHFNTEWSHQCWTTALNHLIFQVSYSISAVLYRRFILLQNKRLYW